MIVPLSDFLRSTPSAAPTGPSPTPTSGTGQVVSLKDFVTTQTPGMARPATTTGQGLTPTGQAVQQGGASSNLGLASMIPMTAGLSRMGISGLLNPAAGSALSRVSGGLGLAGGLAQIPLSILGPGSDARKALGSLGGLATAGSGLVQAFPSLASSLPTWATSGLFGAGTGSALGAVGPILGLGTGALSLAEGQTGAGIGGLAGNAISLAMMSNPYTLPFAWIPSVAGPLIGGFFDKQGNYIPKRQAAMGTAKAGLTQLGTQISGAKSLPELQKALDMASTPAPLLSIPPADLQLLGLPATGAYGKGPQGQVEVRFPQLTPDQFSRLLALTKAQPDKVMSWVGASGDVPYLPYNQAVAVQQAAIRQVQATLKAVAGVPPPAPPAPAQMAGLAAQATPPARATPSSEAFRPEMQFAP